LNSKHYNHKQVTLTLIFDKRRGYHYIRYRLPSIKDINGVYKSRKFKPDENLKFVFNEGYNYTHPIVDRKEIKLSALKISENKKYIQRVNEILAERQTDISRGEYTITPNNQDFYEFTEKWMIDPKSKRSDQTISGYKSLMNHLKIFTNSSNLAFETINEDFVKRFHGYLNEAPSHIKSTNNGKLTGVSINKRLKAFKHVVGEAKRARIIDFHPFADMIFYQRGKTPTSSFRDWLTPDEVNLMMNNPIPYESTVKFFKFSCNSSLAFRECFNLTWKQIRDYGQGSSEIRIKRQKTQKEWIIPITQQAREMLGVRGKEDEKVFDISSNVDDVNKRLQFWSKTNGINKHITSHAGRRSFAYAYYTKTQDIVGLSKILGHSKIETTQRYISPFQYDLTKQMQKLSATGLF
jgi:integrase